MDQAPNPDFMPPRPIDLPLDVRVEREAQRLLDYPDAVEASLCRFEDDLETHYYALMRQHRPASAAYYIATTLRQTVFAAMSSAVFVDTLHEITPELERTGNLQHFYHETDTTYRPIAPPPGLDVYTGSAGQFMQRMITHPFAASRRVIERAMENPNDPYHRLWEGLDASHLQLLSTLRDGGRPKANTYAAWMDAMEGNASTTLEVLLNCGHSHFHAQPWHKFTTKNSLARMVLHNLMGLVWSATAKRTFLVPALHTKALSTEFHLYENRTLHSADEFFGDRKPMLKVNLARHFGMDYRHPSFKAGPWPKAGFCPGVPPLQPKEQADRDIVERFFRFIERRYDCSVSRSVDENGRGDGGFDRVTISLLLGVVLAHGTIYEAWPKVRTPPSDARLSY